MGIVTSDNNPPAGANLPLLLAQMLRADVAPYLVDHSASARLKICERYLLTIAAPTYAAQGDHFELGQSPILARNNASDTKLCSGLATWPAENLAASVAFLQQTARTDARSEADTGERHEALRLEGKLLDRAEHLFRDWERPTIENEALSGPRQLAPELQRYLRSRLGCRALEIQSLQQVPGGRSKQTILFSQSGYSNWPERLVMRRDAPAGPAATTARSVVNEYPVLCALADLGLAVPRALLLESGAELGTAFTIMEQLPGVAAPTPFSPPANQRVALDLAEQLGKLHSLPIDELTPIVNRGNSSEPIQHYRSLLSSMRDCWDRESRASCVAVSVAFDWLAARLELSMGFESILHGDLGFHNVLAQDRLVALLDWELAHIGNPAKDLGYLRPAIERVMPWMAFLDRYRAVGGPHVQSDQINFFTIWESLRMVVSAQRAGAMVRSGESIDVQLAEVGSCFAVRFVNQLSRQLRGTLLDA